MMKLPIKKKYFDKIKSGEKTVELRDAHITFVCEKTGERLRKYVCNVMLLPNDRTHLDTCRDDYVIRFDLSSKPSKKIPREVAERNQRKAHPDIEILKVAS